MNFAVTGGSGFFGAALVKALIDRGDDVRALVRREQAAEQMRALGAEPISGDLTDPNGCAKLAQDGDMIIHAAARVDMNGPWEEFHRTTVEGTRNLLAATLSRRLARFVYISSGAVYAPDAGGDAFCADRTPTRPATHNFYGRAKLAAEDLVRSECEQAGCPWTILRLGFLYGPENQALLHHFVPLAENGKLFIIGDGENRIATLYIDDAVLATISAATNETAENRVYDIASDERVTQREFIEATCEALDVPPPRGRIGRRLAMSGALLIERIAGWTGREVHISRASVALMSADQAIDAGRIRAELGWKPETEFLEGMRRVREWRRQSPTEESAMGDDSVSASATRISR